MKIQYSVSLYKGTAKVKDVPGNTEAEAWANCTALMYDGHYSCKTCVAKLVESAPPPPEPIPVPPLNTTGTAWLYHNGKAYFGADYSWSGAKAEWSTPDTDGGVKCTAAASSGIQPAFPGVGLDIRGKHTFIISIKPTQDGLHLFTRALYVGDITSGLPDFDLIQAKYGPATPVVGQWNNYRVPLADFFPAGIVPDSWYKNFLSPNSNVVFYLKDWGYE